MISEDFNYSREPELTYPAANNINHAAADGLINYSKQAKTSKNVKNTSNHGNLTIKEFCYDYRISKSHFYKLRKMGGHNVPHITKIGGRSIILAEDIQAWKFLNKN